MWCLEAISGCDHGDAPTGTRQGTVFGEDEPYLVENYICDEMFSLGVKKGIQGVLDTVVSVTGDSFLSALQDGGKLNLVAEPYLNNGVLTIKTRVEFLPKIHK